MILRLTKTEMLKRWMEVQLLQPMGNDGCVIRVDGSPIEAVAEAGMRQWYLELLRKGPLEWLDVEELSEELGGVEALGEGLWSIPLPEGLERIASVALAGEGRQVLVVEDSGNPLWLSQRNPFVAASAPVALWERQTSRLLLRTPSDTTSPEISTLRGVIDHEDSYAFDEAALGMAAN